MPETPHLLAESLNWPTALAAEPLLVDDRYADLMRSAFMRADQEARTLEARGNAVEGRTEGRYRTEAGTAIVPISGVLINRSEYFGEGAWATSYPMLSKQLALAAADPQVHRIALAIDSPGGMVSGILQAADSIRAARSAKPVAAIVGGMAGSAAYWLAAQAGSIWLSDDFSQVGSIGVYTMHMDVSGALKQMGIDISLIHAGANKVDGHPFAALPKDVRAEMQASVEATRLIFARAVVAGRASSTDPISLEDVLATEARTYRAYDPQTETRPALDAKLADRMGTLQDFILSPPESSGASRRGNAMSTTITKEDHDAAILKAKTEAKAAGFAEGEKAGKAQGFTEGEAAASARIQGILGSEEARGREALASHFAYKTPMSAEDAKAALVAAPAQASAPAGGELAAAMAAAAQPRLGSAAAPSEPASDFEAGAAAFGALLGKKAAA